MKNKLIFLGLAYFGFLLSIHAQNLTKRNNSNSIYSMDGKQDSKSIAPLIFSKDASFDLEDLGELNSKSGNVHNRFRINYQDIPFKGIQVVQHYYARSNTTDFVVSNFIPAVKSLKVKTNISLTEAKTIAQDEGGLSNYDFVKISKTTNDKGLIFAPQDFNFKKPTWVLAYEIDIHSTSPLLSQRVTINAQSGAIIFVENKLCSVEGTAETYYHGTKTVETTADGQGFVLLDQTRGDGIRTVNLNTGNMFFDDDNFWNNINPEFDQIAGDVHWGSSATFDFYLEQLGLNGFNSNGKGVESHVHLQNTSNAYWDGVNTLYGDGDPSSPYNLPFTYINIVGHEITHAVTEYHSGLIYSDESGGLNESISDIIGMSVQHFNEPGTVDWKVGDDVSSTGAYFRNMANPNDVGMADTYEGDFWFDSFGPHSLSSIGNYWFYLLVNGGTGTNDNGYEYNVSGIGWEEAWALAGETWVYYLTPGSTYEDCALASMQVANDIYGSCSVEVADILEAWRAVGVLDLNLDQDFEVSSTNFCELPAHVDFQSIGDITNHAWTFGDGGMSTDANPSHTYMTNGVFTVSLTGLDCNNESFTITKTDLISVDINSTSCDTIFMIDNLMETVTSCQGIIVDDGGINGNYSNGIQSSLIIESFDGVGYVLDLQSFESESCCDGLSIYVDNGSGFELLMTLVGNLSSQTIEILGPKVRIDWTTDGSVTRSGFYMTWQCILPSPPIANFEADNVFLCESVMNFTDLSLNLPTSWVWLIDNVASSTEQNPSLNFPTPGIYDIGLIACNDLGCDTIQFEDYINYDPDSGACDTIVILDDMQEVINWCSGVVVDDGGVNGNYNNNVEGSLEINIPDAFGFHIDFEFFNTESGWDYVRIFADYGNGFELYETYSGSIDPHDFQIPASSIRFEWDSDGSVTREGFIISWQCLDDSIAPIFNYNSFIDECSKTVDFELTSPNTESVVWFFGDGTSEAGFQVQHTYLNDGEFTVIVEATNANGTSSDAFDVEVEFNIVMFDIAEQVLVNSTINMVPTTHNNWQINQINWFLNGEVISNDFSFDFVYDVLGTHDLVCVITDNNNCTTSHSETIEVVTIIDVDDFHYADKIALYPNPTNAVLNIDNLDLIDGSIELSIFNNIGQSIWTQSIAEGVSRQLIDTDDLAPGLYMLRFESKDIGTFYKKFVKVD